MSPPPLHLLDLPIEILTLILRPLLTTHPPRAPIPLCACSPAPLAHLSCVLPILLAHPRLHAVATPLLYGPEHEFLLDLAGAHHARARREFEDPSSSELPSLSPPSPLGLPRGGGGGGDHGLMDSRDALRRVARLSLRLDRLRGWMAERVVPLVADMILRGQLTALDVFVVTDGAQHRQQGGKKHLRYDRVRLMPGSPLAGIMGLLADPYLRSARMFIQVGHGAEWCQFHGDGRGGCSEGEGEGEGEDGDASSRDGVVEVDWRSMIRDADPAGEHFPVAKALGERTGA
ncbi:hypothetical protein ACO1O0_003319 [Amphichorda felina]